VAESPPDATSSPKVVASGTVDEAASSLPLDQGFQPRTPSTVTNGRRSRRSLREDCEDKGPVLTASAVPIGTSPLLWNGSRGSNTEMDEFGRLLQSGGGGSSLAPHSSTASPAPSEGNRVGEQGDRSQTLQLRSQTGNRSGPSGDRGQTLQLPPRTGNSQSLASSGSRGTLGGSSLAGSSLGGPGGDETGVSTFGTAGTRSLPLRPTDVSEQRPTSAGGQNRASGEQRNLPRWAKDPSVLRRAGHGITEKTAE